MYEYKCKVNRVVDGDTIDVSIDLGFKIHHEARVRLYGIDAPESRTSDKEAKKYGIMSKEFLNNAVYGASEVLIRTSKEDAKGKFGRVLGSVIIDGVDINKLMVEKHLAVEYYGQNKTDILAQHLVNRGKLDD